MTYLACDLLHENEHRSLRRKLLEDKNWIDGSTTASGYAKQLKKNLQLAKGDSYIKYSNEIISYLQRNTIVQNFSFPSNIFRLLFSRTGTGMYYGPHIDDPFIEDKRRDLSFTIFLNEPNEYKGGELILYIPPERKSIKLKAGQIVIYPTKFLHEVKEVTEGERMVCVGWIESLIPSDDDREVLTMLRNSVNELVKLNGFNNATLNLYVAFNRIYKKFISN